MMSARHVCMCSVPLFLYYELLPSHSIGWFIAFFFLGSRRLLEQGGALGVVQYYFYEALDLAREWPIAAAAAGQ